MGFATTKFQAQFAGRVLSNLTTLLERDTEAALKELDETLPQFRDFRTPVPLALNFPALFVNLDRNALDQSADDSYITQTQQYTVDVAIVGPDSFTNQQQIVQYVTAIDRVIRTATPGDLIGGVTLAVGPPVWEVTGHEFVLSKNGTQLRADAFLTVTIQFIER